MDNDIVIIHIDGESAEDMFAAGAEDLAKYILPEQLVLNEKDVVSVVIRSGKLIDTYDRNNQR